MFEPEMEGIAGADSGPKVSSKCIIIALGTLPGPDVGEVLLACRKEIRRRARENFPPLQEFLDWEAKDMGKGRRPKRPAKRRFHPVVQPPVPPLNRKKILRHPMGKPLPSTNFWTPKFIGAAGGKSHVPITSFLRQKSSGGWDHPPCQGHLL